MGIKNDCRRNTEGYSDPTAYEALKNMEQEEERIVIKDKRTGRIWR